MIDRSAVQSPASLATIRHRFCFYIKCSKCSRVFCLFWSICILLHHSVQLWILMMGLKYANVHVIEGLFSGDLTIFFLWVVGRSASKNSYFFLLIYIYIRLCVDLRHVCRLTSLYIYVCVSTDVMFVDWRHYKDWAVCRHEVVCRLTSCLSTNETTDRDTNDVLCLL